MRNSIFSGILGIALGSLVTFYRFEILALVTGKSQAQAISDVTLSEKRKNDSKESAVTTIVMASALRKAAESNPELKEMIMKERFKEFIKTEHSKKFLEADQEFQVIQNNRFRNLSVADLMRYKEFLVSDYYQRMMNDSQDNQEATKGVFDKFSEELRLIVIKEAKEMVK